MSARLDPLFRYRPEATIIHRIPALMKLVGLAAAGVCAFLPNPVFPIACGLALIALALLARIPLAAHRQNARILFWYALAILFFRFAGPLPDAAALKSGLADSGIYLFRLALAVLAGTVFYETTSSLEIRQAIYRVQDALARIAGRLLPARLSPATRRYPDVALLLSLTISFIPRIFDAWSRLNRSWDARGGARDRSPRGAWKRLTTLIPLLIVTLLDVAAETDRAIQNRSIVK